MARIIPASTQQQRDGSGEGEDQDQRAFELAQQKPQGAQAWSIIDAARPCRGKQCSSLTT
jgi:hypothetical protein